MTRGAVVAVILSATLVTAALVVTLALPDAPQEVAAQYLRDRYANRARLVYAVASSADQAERTLADYLAANPEFPESFQPGVDALARAIRVQEATTEQEVDQAQVTLRLALPNSADGDLDALLRVGGADDAFTDATPSQIVRQIRADARAGTLPMVEVTEVVDLVREHGRWRIFLGWGTELQITLAASVAEGAPLAFRLVAGDAQRLRPGETGRARFTVRNTSERQVRMRATHRFDPAIAQRHIELIQCFCFFEERLDAGETRDLPLVFRLGWDIPTSVDAISIAYEYDTVP